MFGLIDSVIPVWKERVLIDCIVAMQQVDQRFARFALKDHVLTIWLL